MNVSKGTIAWVYFLAIVLLVGFIILIVLLQGNNFVTDAVNSINDAFRGGILQ